MMYRREMGAATSSPPFLSVVTRCYKRPTMLEANKASLAMQTDPDYEQLYIIDDEGKGLHAANMALANVEPEGEYVLILDDDDELASETAIERLKGMTSSGPDMVIFQAEHAELGVLPDRIVWNARRPIHGRIGSCDFIVERKLWLKHIPSFGAPSSGDYHFLKSLWSDKPDVKWMHEIMARVQRISRGRPE